MKRDNVNYLAAGGTVLVAFGFLFLVLYQITGRSGDTDDYFVYYSEVAGLRYGTPVYFEGYRVGQVEGVTPEIDGTQTRFRVDLTVEEGWPIPDDSVAEITTSGLLSDVFIVLDQGESTTLLPPGSELIGQEAADVFAALNDLATELSRLTQTKLNPMLEMANDRLDVITGELANNTPGMVQDLRVLVAKLNEAAENVKTLVGDDNIDRVGVTLENFEAMSVHARDLAAELRATREELHVTLTEVRAAVQDSRPDLEQMVDELARTVDAASRRLDSIGYNLDETSRNLNEFARAIRMSPNRLIFAQEDDPVEVEE